jgi:hypothetical protein
VTTDREHPLYALPWALRNLYQRLTWHTDVRWDVPDYVDDVAHAVDDRRATTDPEVMEAVSSCTRATVDRPAGERHHALLIDVDCPAWLIPSSTGGHGHLYVDLDIPDAALWRFLDAAAGIGLVEEGYVNACRERGMTSLRAPWIVKGEEPSTLRRQAELDAEQKAAAERMGF